MSDLGEWGSRYADRNFIAEQLRRHLRVRIFGPYAGECSYILGDVAEQLREEDNYDARICLEVPESATLNDQDDDKDIYNLDASIECLNTADAAVFVFMSSEEYRFEGAIPHEIHSSAVIELYHWCQLTSSNSPTLVII